MRLPHLLLTLSHGERRYAEGKKGEQQDLIKKTLVAAIENRKKKYLKISYHGSYIIEKKITSSKQQNN